LRDAERAALEPQLLPPSWIGRPLKWLRHCPPWQTTQCQLHRRRSDGTLEQMSNALRERAR
jgi:hypothetical protein